MNEYDFFKEPIVDSLKILEDHYGFDIEDLDNSDWFQISKLELSEEFMEKFKDKIDWDEHFYQWEVDEKIVAKYADKVTLPATWDSISYQKGLSQEFILSFHDKLNSTIIAEHQKIPTKLIVKWAKDEKSKDLVDKALEYQKITSKLLSFLIQLDFPIDWYELSKKGRVTKEAFLTHYDSFLWEIISEHRELSEQNLIEFQNYLSWEIVSKHQKMSVDFIVKMSENINIDALKQNQKVNQKELEDKEIYLLLKLSKS